MKINRTGPVNKLNQYHHNQIGKPVSSEKNWSKKDEVNISPEAKELLGARETANMERASHVQHIKQRVSIGTYHVDAAQIANKLLPYVIKNFDSSITE